MSVARLRSIQVSVTILVALVPGVFLIQACDSSGPRSGSSATPAIHRGGSIGSPPPVASSASSPALPADATLLTLVDKQHALPLAYVPLDLVPIPEEYVSSLDRQQLRQAAKEALVRMLNVALQEGLTIKVNSAYRSAQYQLAVFRTEVAAVGCTQALRESAVPGHSEHQLGLAADLTTASVGWGLEDAFGQTVEGRWLAEHAAGYGFVLSYPEGKETVTGYQFEPWHYRYVTEPLAAAIVRSRKTPAEYLGSLGSVSSTPLSSSTPEAVAATACA